MSGVIFHVLVHKWHNNYNDLCGSGVAFYVLYELEVLL